MSTKAARKNENTSAVRTPRWFFRVFSIALVLLVATVGSLYLRIMWDRYLQTDIENAINYANTVGALMHPDNIAQLSGTAEDINHPAYREAKSLLIRLIQANRDTPYAYVVRKAGDGFVLLLDTAAAPQDPALIAATFKLLRQELLDAFEADEALFSGVIRNDERAWLRTLTPLRSDTTGETVAVLGITYTAISWNQAMLVRFIPHVFLVFALFILTILLIRILHTQAMLKIRSEMLAQDEVLFHNVFDQAPIGISIGGNEKVTYTSLDARFSVNPMFETILGRSRETLEKTSWQEITHPDDLQADLANVEQFKQGIIDRYTMEKRYIRPDGSIVWTNMTIGHLVGTHAKENMHLCILEDITARKKAEQALLESERSKAVLLSHLPGLAYRCKYDPRWTMEFVSEGCEALTGYLPEALINNHELSYADIIAPEYRDELWSEWKKLLHQDRTFRHEYEIITKNGERKWVLELGQFIYQDGLPPVALEGIVIDISEQKNREAQIAYLNIHDNLTGLYNRVHYVQERERLSNPANFPLAVVVCDINGVRLVNDAFGPAEGDRLIIDVAHLLRSFCRKGDVYSRTGGDEFTLLLPHTTESEAIALIEQMELAVTRYNHSDQPHPYEVSLSFGHSVMDDSSLSIDHVCIAAEEHLHHRKLLNQQSSHNAILSSIMATLYARSQETEAHGKRLTRFTRMIGESMNLDLHTLDALELLSMLHDIGKIGVDDRILNKPEALTPDEWELMMKHPEIGWRIALSSPELAHIAQYILYHHEKWDGSGYPAGLKGEDIPLPARILAVADAYDAMTEDRVYRKALTKQQALEEIKHCAGTQFDPAITKVFLDILEKEEPGA